MTDQPSLKRDGTMQVTAQHSGTKSTTDIIVLVILKEGEAFLETHGMKVTDDDVKTRGQKEMLEQLTTPLEEETADEVNMPKMPREGTMAVTAKEGMELLGDESFEKTRQQTAASKEEQSNGKEEEEEEEEEAGEKPNIVRDNTMVATAKEGQQLLDGEDLEKTRAQTAAAKNQTSPATTPTTPKVKRTTTIAQTTEDSTHILGDEEFGKTRSSTRRISETDEVKPAVKRATTMEQTAKEGEEFLARGAKRAKLDEDQPDDNLPQETAAES